MRPAVLAELDYRRSAPFGLARTAPEGLDAFDPAHRTPAAADWLDALDDDLRPLRAALTRSRPA